MKRHVGLIQHLNIKLSQLLLFSSSHLFDLLSVAALGLENGVQTVKRQPCKHGSQCQGEYHLIGTEFFHICDPKSRIQNRYDSVSSPNAECRTRTANSVYFSSMMQEIRISDVLIKRILIFSAARVANMVDATPE